MGLERQGLIFWPEWTVDQFWSALWRHVRGVGCYKLSSLEQPWAGMQRSQLFLFDEATNRELLLYDIEVTVKQDRPWVKLKMPWDIEAKDVEKAEAFWHFFCQTENVEDSWIMRAEFGMTLKEEIEFMKQLRIGLTEEFQQRAEKLLAMMWDTFGGLATEADVEASEQAEPQADSDTVAKKGYHRELREETKWYDEWVRKYLLNEEISRQELNDEFVKWRRGLSSYDLDPDLGPLRTALSKRRRKWGVKGR